MKFLAISIRNYAPFYGDHVFGLADRGLTLIMGDNRDEPRMDSNGAGKSSIFDALDWCLFGVSPRGDHADSMVNEEAFSQRGAECQVVVNLVDDKGQSWVIQRGRSKSKNTLVLRGPGGLVEALDVKATQVRIEEVLGLDREVFHAAVLFAQGDMVRYADSTDAERMSILTRILQLGEIDEYLDRTKSLVKVLESDLARYSNARAILGGQRSVLEAQDYEANEKAWEYARKAALGQYDTQIAQAKAQVAVLQAEGVNPTYIQQQRDQAQAELTAMAAPMESPELTVAWERMRVQDVEARTLVGQLQAAQTALQKVEATGEGVCRECGQQITGEHLAFERARLAESVVTFRSASQSAAGQLHQVTEVVRQLEAQQAQVMQAWQIQRDEVTRRFATLDAQVREAASKQAEVGRAQDAVQRLVAAKELKALETNPFEVRERERRGALDKLAHQEADLDQVEFYATEDLKYLAFWVQAFGSKGLKSYILDTRIQEMTVEVNRWVQMLTGGTIWVQFEAQKQTRGKKLVNAPAIRVCRWNPDGTITERNYQSWSGGEKQRISFAVDFGLSRLIARRARNKYDLLILDEVFKHLDRAGKEAVVEMLQVLSRERSSVFVVEHDDEFKGAFENIVSVTKQNRRSEFVSVPTTTSHNTAKVLRDRLEVGVDQRN